MLFLMKIRKKFKEWFNNFKNCYGNILTKEKEKGGPIVKKKKGKTFLEKMYFNFLRLFSPMEDADIELFLNIKRENKEKHKRRR